MARYQFDGTNVLLYLAQPDVGLLGSLIEQLIDLLTDGMPEPAGDDPAGDPFALWEADLGETPDEPEALEDPALQRLFPNPYPHDARAASDYRRYAETDARRNKIEAARTVAAALTAAPPVRVPLAEVDSWLKTLNALRLVLATRLGVDDADAMDELQSLADDDPRSMMAAIMDWLGYLQGIIIELTEGGTEQ